MNILYVSQYFPPEMGAPAARVSELARHWRRADHSVEVLTAFPNHPTGTIPKEYKAKLWRLVIREVWEGVSVVRTWLIPLPNRKPVERMINYSSFCLSACLTGMMRPRPDVIIATSPQLLVGLAGWWLSRVKRVPFVLEVRDLWPESIEAAGVSTKRSLLMRTLARLARRLYGTCDHIVVVSPAFKDFIRDRYGIEEKKIAVIENGVDIGLFKPQAKRPIGKERGRFVVSYIGTLGFAHGLETVIEAARILQNTTPDIAFVFVGEGAEKAGLMHLCSRYRLSNITFVGEQPRSLVPQWISESDVCLVVLKNAPIFKTVIPTKMLEFMACGRPVILSADGEARRLLEEAKAGMSVEPEKPAALAEAIRMLHGDAVLRSRFGDHGRAYIWRHLSREATASQYLTVLAAIIQNRNIPLRTVNTAPASVERLVERDISSVK